MSSSSWFHFLNCPWKSSIYFDGTSWLNCCNGWKLLVVGHQNSKREIQHKVIFYPWPSSIIFLWMGLHQMQMALLAPDVNLLRFSLPKRKTVKQCNQSSIRDKFRHITMCLYLVKPNCWHWIFFRALCTEESFALGKRNQVVKVTGLTDPAWLHLPLVGRGL